MLYEICQQVYVLAYHARKARDTNNINDSHTWEPFKLPSDSACKPPLTEAKRNEAIMWKSLIAALK